MAEVKKQSVITKEVGDFQEEELKATEQRIVEEKLQLIADLNKIKVPLSVQVFSHHGSWSIRNKAFWQAMNGRDDKVMEFMEKYLTEKK